MRIYVTFACHGGDAGRFTTSLEWEPRVSSVHKAVTPHIAARLIVILALIGGCLSVSASPALALPLEQHSPVTWNMQGATIDGESKWTSNIPTLANGNSPSGRQHDLLALQEAGPVPAHDVVGRNDRGFVYQGSVSALGLTVYRYTRQIGSGSRGHNWTVYFMDTGGNGSRVNLATMVWDPADAIALFTNPNGRATFGLRYGPTVFFNIHAQSGGGGDGPALVNRIIEWANQNMFTAAILGDFNREPHSYIDAGLDVYRSDRATQRSSGELDYMITNFAPAPIAGHGYYSGRLLGGMSSDHFPVDFGYPALLAAAGYEISNYANLSGDGERVADVPGGNSANGTRIDLWDPNYGSNQNYHMVRARDNSSLNIVNNATGKCLDLEGGTEARAGSYVNEWDCQGQSTQSWGISQDPHRPDEMVIKNVSTGLCLDDPGSSSDNGVPIEVWYCNGGLNQDWTLSPEYSY
ncbi:RICIN domain-containing protein [Krasilnikovia sp. MM14-A1004]|uniref:RICIN domain-containing protein n=1 Tax=Krasilnikovia sp. MM14-A1004 TaxID=3373541 RepID=UPI00399C5C10